MVSWLKNHFEIEVKRLKLPLSIKAKCPFCEKIIESIPTEKNGYFSYLDINKPIDIQFYHEDNNGNEHEFYLENVIFSINVDISKSKIKLD